MIDQYHKILADNIENINTPTFVFNDDIAWQMSRAEKYALNSILEKLKPSVSVEIGTYKGGSLEIINKHSLSVYSIDIDNNVQKELSNQYRNVNFVCGRSSDLISTTINFLDEIGPNFILIDGDHTEDGVCNDISIILKNINNSTTMLLMHDSFNPECRKGILKSPWQQNDRVHFLDVDFISGALHENAFDQAGAMTMWGGFACAIILQKPRNYNLKLLQSQQRMFEIVREACHQNYKLSLKF